MRALFVVLLVGCVPPPSEICRRGVELECTRQFECQSAAVKSTPGFQGGYGTSVEDCQMKVAAQARCDEKASQDELCTGMDTGKTFDVSKASACSGDRKAQSCEDFLDPAKLPQSCNEKCR